MTGDSDARSRAIEGFVARLVDVREQAGSPSFREMAKRSGAISHATLHDALQGTRMPSWETTVELAKACDTDPAELREEWEQACAQVQAADGNEPAPASSPEPTDPDLPGSGSSVPADDETDPAPSRSGQHLARAGLAVGVLALVAAAAALWLTQDQPEADADLPPADEITGEAAAAYTSASGAPSTTTDHRGCPGNAPVSPTGEPRAPGDAATFVDDVTISDCSTQPRGETVVKTWKLRNTGDVTWKGRYLHRINVGEGSPACRAPERVAIPDTDPGETVEVSVTIATPEEPATCFARWMQTDGEGNFTFPAQRPYYYSFFVE